jgi:hypothetical protein
MPYQFQQIDLVEEGPIVEAEVFRDEAAFLQFKNLGIPENFAKVRLLIDTGSNISGLDSSFISQLNLSPYADTDEWVHNHSGSSKVMRYGCVLYLPVFKKKALNIDILEGNYGSFQIDGVLGRDILRFCNFKYNGISNEFRLEAKGF